MSDGVATGFYRTIQSARRPLLRRHPNAQSQYAKTLKLLEANPHHPSLRLHALKGKLSGLHSVSINLSYRITLALIITGSEVVLINIGDHDAVYF